MALWTRILYMLNKVRIEMQYDILHLTFVGDIYIFFGKSLKKRLRRAKHIQQDFHSWTWLSGYDLRGILVWEIQIYRASLVPGRRLNYSNITPVINITNSITTGNASFKNFKDNSLFLWIGPTHNFRSTLKFIKVCFNT